MDPDPARSSRRVRWRSPLFMPPSKRAVAINNHVESGFPHGKFQFISDTAGNVLGHDGAQLRDCDVQRTLTNGGTLQQRPSETFSGTRAHAQAKPNVQRRA